MLRLNSLYAAYAQMYLIILKKKLNTKKKTKTGVQEPEKMSIFKRMTNAVHNETFPFITGAVLVVLAIFVVISYISFLTIIELHDINLLELPL